MLIGAVSQLLSPIEEAFLRVFRLSAVATPDDYRVLELSVNLDVGALPHHVKRSLVLKHKKYWDWDHIKHLPVADNPGAGNTAVLGLGDVPAILQTGALSEEKLNSLTVMISQDEEIQPYIYISLAMWMTALSDDAYTALSKNHWFDHPPGRLMSLTADKLVALRRVQRAGGCSEATSAEITNAVRKFSGMLGRQASGEADWQAEKHRRTINTPVHNWVDADGTVDRQRWCQELDYELRRFAQEVVEKVNSSNVLENPDSWWSSRALWAPSGSSSAHKVVEQACRAENQNLKSHARANKAAVLPFLDDKFFMTALLTSEPMKRPRKSTKREKGNKNRALYAVDDVPFLISSYASVSMERSINQDGVYAQQAPSDVARWVAMHQMGSELSAFFMSLDYSDYNSDHELSALAMVDLAFARAWNATSSVEHTSLFKAMASVWSAYAHFNSWVDFDGTGEPQRVLSGLFSGDRNTARDNCILHMAYSRVCAKMATEWGFPPEIIDIMMTGDDEDGIFRHWIGALAYQAAHYEGGFVLKPAKQLAGHGHNPSHEYLQRWLGRNKEPTRPLAAAIAELASGNWYKMNQVWLDSVIPAVNDNLWEIHLRGLPLKTARLVAGVIFNRTVQTRGPSGWRKLEWWEYRTNGEYHPLWDTITPEAPKLSDGSAAVYRHPIRKGVDSWVRKQKGRFKSLLNDQALSRIARAVNQDIHTALYPKERNLLMKRDALESWPKRRTQHWAAEATPPASALAAKLSDEMLQLIINTQEHVRIPSTERELIARFGVDAMVVKEIGGINNLLSGLPPHEMAKWSNTMPLNSKPLAGWYYDPAIRSFLVNTRLLE